jgi:SWI/SNF related-matrix-associated actin-dependent regulator of chromatin subfamily C
VEKHNNSSISQNDNQESDGKSVSRDDCPIKEAKTNNAKESGDSTATVDKSATDNAKGLISSMKGSVTLDNMTECGLLASPVVVAGSNIGASNPKQVNDKPNVEVEAPDDSSLKGKNRPNKTEDAVATPPAQQDNKQSETLENGNMGGTSSVFSHRNYLYETSKG